MCWCRSPTSTIEAPVSVDTLAPDSLSQQVYSRVRQSLAGAIAQPRPCGHLGIRPSRHTDKPTLVQRRGRALFVWKLGFLTSLTWLRPRRACCLQDLARKNNRKEALHGRPCQPSSASFTYEIPSRSAPCRVELINIRHSRYHLCYPALYRAFSASASSAPQPSLRHLRRIPLPYICKSSTKNHKNIKNIYDCAPPCC